MPQAPRPPLLLQVVSIVMILFSLSFLGMLCTLFFHEELAMRFVPIPVLPAVTLMGILQYSGTFRRDVSSAKYTVWLNGGLGILLLVMFLPMTPDVIRRAIVESQPSLFVRLGIIYVVIFYFQVNAFVTYRWWQTLKRYAEQLQPEPPLMRLSMREMLLGFAALSYVLAIMAMLMRTAYVRNTF
ncbi:hypothetical protein [Blastopirellula marina]|uniref:Uncharacterized protein n=1 Tax=Blastopirellula marina TaxID=124 RepID=A0A2S8GMH5_9BACT|nr:hypothetical protein [Blastopirellula marina]PQO45224.1 hypothetical protein C5Y93_14775 [Blastopirellula marina]